jgi:hypothetical protein
VNNKSVVVIIHSHRMNLLPAPLCFGVEHHCLDFVESGFDRLEPSVHILALFDKLLVDRVEPSVDRLESSVHVLALFDKLLLDSVILEALLILMAFDENHQTRVNIFVKLPVGWRRRLIRISGNARTMEAE